MRYIALVDGKAGAYGVVVPDLPGCTSAWPHDGRSAAQRGRSGATVGRRCDSTMARRCHHRAQLRRFGPILRLPPHWPRAPSSAWCHWFLTRPSGPGQSVARCRPARRHRRGGEGSRAHTFSISRERRREKIEGPSGSRGMHIRQKPQPTSRLVATPTNGVASRPQANGRSKRRVK